MSALQLRMSGIDIIGSIPWGTHFCQLYQTRDDLIETLVPYFKAGLKNNEFCIWITSEPLNEEEAREAMREAMPDFDEYARKEQIEIIPYTEWYLKDGAFEYERVRDGWLEKQDQALAGGHDGLRLAGTTFWLENYLWKDFADYELEVNNIIGRYKMLAVCPYSLDKCGANEILDVVNTHQFALIKREGAWKIIESHDLKQANQALRAEITERKRMEETLKESNQQLDLLSYTAGKLLTSEKAHQELERQVKERTAELEKANMELEAEIRVRKQAEESVKAERQRFNDILEMLPAYLVLLTPDYHVTFANRFFRERFGESHGRRCFEYLFGRSEPCEICETYTVLKTMAPHHWEWTGPDGHNYDIFDFPFTDTDGSALIMEVGIDITERKRAEERIREQAALLDNAHDAIAVRNMDHCLIYWNKGAQSLYGWTVDEVLGRNADKLIYKEESPALTEAKKNVIERGEWTGELHQVAKGGKEVTVESRWTLVQDNEGKPKSILIINTDITEKKNLESQLLRAQRMESIGTLAGGIAHDLNNILTPIMMSVQMLKEKTADEQSQKLLNILEKNSQRGANLIKQVLSFARGMEGKRTPLQVAYLISEIERVIKETFPRDIEIQTGIQKDLFMTSGDSTQLHQVIMNLCVNARDAMQEGGVLSISAENFFIDENYARMHLEAKVGSYVVVAVSDTGVGIPPEILDRIFEPFFTTKEQGKGTGLGLSTALAIVKGHGGFINVYSEMGKGTTFKVYLPAIKTEIQKSEEQFVELQIGNGELILIAEDEASVLEITKATLEAHGYRVLTAGDGAEAIAVYAKNVEEIKVVLMDMMMPIMDGPSSIRALRKINPGVKIIAVSGLTENSKLTKITGDNVHGFLPKPYTAERMLKAIHEVLSS
ncbi:MAG: MEDS domain-containing protein [Candidatus Methanoperedens sp.]|nr:MEDS domain-containing protein [Candidatus Methanoperedens sp.]